jgi:hypothetical protein
LIFIEIQVATFHSSLHQLTKQPESLRSQESTAAPGMLVMLLVLPSKGTENGHRIRRPTVLFTDLALSSGASGSGKCLQPVSRSVIAVGCGLRKGIS